MVSVDLAITTFSSFGQISLTLVWIRRSRNEGLGSQLAYENSPLQVGLGKNVLDVIFWLGKHGYNDKGWYDELVQIRFAEGGK